MKKEEYICSLCKTNHNIDLRVYEPKYGVKILYCPVGKMLFYTNRNLDGLTEFIRDDILKEYTKEELWAILKRIRERKLILEESEFKIPESLETEKKEESADD